MGDHPPRPKLMTRSSSYSPPDGKLAPECFDVSFKYATDSLWVVAIDGSALGKNALHLAAWLMNPKNKLKGGQDNVLVVHCTKPGSTNDLSHLFATCTTELMKCGLWEQRIKCQGIELPHGWGVGDAIVYFANHVGLAQDDKVKNTHLVLGCAGPDDTGNYSRMGEIAKQCLAKVKVPVTVVKDKWVYKEGALGRLARLGMNGQPGIKVVVCVDGSVSSDLALDKAASLCREGDTLEALYVTSAEHEMDETARIASKYGAECAKIKESIGLVAGTFKNIEHDPHSGTSIADDIVTAAFDADLIVMGSVELVNIKRRHTLGSVCISVAKHPTAHLCVVKHYPH
jgi:nucleotide-binding universal stress UspA family protein